MKVIPINLLSEVTFVSSENANYPASNIIDDHPKKVWKATSATASMIVSIGPGASSAFALFNTNASGVTFQLDDPNKIEWESGVEWEDGVDFYFIIPTLTETLNLSGDAGSCMVEWEEISSTISLTINLINEDGEAIYAGVGTAGKLYEYEGPSYNFSERLKDLSIVKENSNGSVYIKGRDVLRVFNLEASLLTYTAFDEFIFTIAKIVKSSPAAWMVTNVDNSRWLVYARFTGMPGGEFYTSTRTRMNCELTEVL